MGLGDRLGASRCHSSWRLRDYAGAVRTVEPGHAGEVMGQIGHADLHRRPDRANGAHGQRHAVRLGGEDMLDAGAGIRARDAWFFASGPESGRFGGRRSRILSDRPRRSRTLRLRLARQAVSAQTRLAVFPGSSRSGKLRLSRWTASVTVQRRISPLPPTDADVALVFQDQHRDLDRLELRAFGLELGPAALQCPTGSQSFRPHLAQDQPSGVLPFQRLTFSRVNVWYGPLFGCGTLLEPGGFSHRRVSARV